MATFKADVTVSGDAAAGTMTVNIVQMPVAAPAPTPTPVPTPTTAPVPMPAPTAWEPPSWLRTDTAVAAPSTMSRPAYRVPYVDQNFKTKITRVSGDPGTPILNISAMSWPDVARHHYSSDQAWNCDQSLIYLDSPGILINGSTYEPLFKATGRPSDSDVRWNAKDPALFNFAAGSRLGTWNPKTGAQVVIKDFGSAYSSMKFGPWEGCFSANGDMVAPSCVVSGVFTSFAYRVSDGWKGPDIKASSVASGTCDSVRISPLGNYIIWFFDPNVVYITDLTGKKITTLPNNYVSHIDVIVDGNGDEVLVGRVNDGSVGQGPSGRISKYRLRDGVRTQLSTGGWSYHTSCRAQARGRWSVSAPGDEGGNYPPYNGEVIMCELDGSKVYRLGHTHTPRTVDYKAEVQASHSPDGGRVIFASAWGASGSTPRPVGCYVIDFRV